MLAKLVDPDAFAGFAFSNRLGCAKFLPDVRLRGLAFRGVKVGRFLALEVAAGSDAEGYGQESQYPADSSHDASGSKLRFPVLS